MGDRASSWVSWASVMHSVALLTFSPVVCSAQPAPTARSSFDAGIAAMENNRYMDAVVALEESNRLRPLPVVLFNLGLAYRAVGRERQAIVAFERYLAAPERNADANRISAVEQELTALRARACTVLLHARPSNAIMQIDGRPQSALRGEVAVDPGPHVIEVIAEGYRPHREEHTLAPGRRLELDVVLDALPSAGRRPPPSGLTPLVLPEAPEVPEAPPVELENSPRTPPETSSSRGLSAAFWVGVGVGAVAAATSTGLWLDGNSQQRSYDLACRNWPPARDCDQRFQSVQDTLDSRASLVNGMWTVAALGTAVALVDVVLSALSGSGPAAREAPERRDGPRELVRLRLGVDRAGVEVRW